MSFLPQHHHIVPPQALICVRHDQFKLVFSVYSWLQTLHVLVCSSIFVATPTVLDLLISTIVFSFRESRSLIVPLSFFSFFWNFSTNFSYCWLILYSFSWENFKELLAMSNCVEIYLLLRSFVSFVYFKLSWSSSRFINKSDISALYDSTSCEFS